MNRLIIAAACLLLAAFPIQAGENWVSLFNGKDLSEWVNVNCAPETFSVKDNVIVCTGKPTGVIRTPRQYENFILEMEWMHRQPKGNAGLFIWSDPLTAVGQPFTRAIEVQILDGLETPNYTSHGDIFSIHGATMIPDRPHPNNWPRCLPSEKRSKPAGEWNHYRVECKDGSIKLAVNGKIVSGGHDCSPRKGYICLESEGSEVLFKNIRIQELPGGSATPRETAEVAKDFVLLYNGLDLRGWKHDPGHTGHWKPSDWVLKYDGKSEAKDKNLWTEKEYGDFEMICDWRLNGKPTKMKRPLILPNGDYATDADGKKKEVEVLDGGDSGIYLRGSSKSQLNIWCWPIGSGEVYGYRNDPKQSPEVRQGVTPRVRADNDLGKWNRFHITMKGDRLTVVLNGKTVIENAQLPGVAPRGPIALQHHGDALEFANIYIRELR